MWTGAGAMRFLAVNGYARKYLSRKLKKLSNSRKYLLKIRMGQKSKLSIFRDITNRKQREAKLKASVEEYRALFEHVAVGVSISTKEGKFIDANQAMLDILGYSSKEEFLELDIVNQLLSVSGRSPEISGND